MSNIKKWGYIYKTYDSCSRIAILKNTPAFRQACSTKWNNAYWSYLFLYLSISVLCGLFVYLWPRQFYFLIALMLANIALTWCLLEYSLSKHLARYYQAHDLKQYSTFLRSRYISYLLFKEKLDKDNIINKDDIQLLIKWAQVGTEKIDKMVFFQSKWLFAAVTTLAALIGGHFLGLDANLNANELAILTVISLVILWLCLVAFDLSLASKQKQLNVSRFLKWYQIDAQT